MRGNTIFPPNILGRFAILCAILRQLHLVLHILLDGELIGLAPDAFFVDQLSACLLILRLLVPNTRILFYCHFPDKLLASRQTWLKRTYRIPFDWFEAWTTGVADSLVVNSRFTRGVFEEAFPTLRHRKPAVVYPCVDTRTSQEVTSDAGQKLWEGKKVVLSINRFERKKGVELAVKAYAGLAKQQREGVRLVLAGKALESLSRRHVD